MEDDIRIVSGYVKENEINTELSLRPQTLNDYIGQSKVKENMRIFIEAAKSRGDSLDHVLLYGPPGLGKTTLAHIIANEMGVHFIQTSGPSIESQRDLASMLSKVEEGDVLFIDEIHRLSANMEEILYPAMEDYAMDIMLGKGPTARTMRLDLPRFTLVGATTRAGMLTSPLRDRFGIINRLEIYTNDELKTIVKRSANILNIQADEEGLMEIARRSRGTPRIANRLLRRVRDYAQIKAGGTITRKIADEALRMFEVDEEGLDSVDRRILTTIIQMFKGGPVGLDTLAAATGEETATVEDVYEPYLLQMGYLMRTPRGRIATQLAYKHLGIPMEKNDTKENTQMKLF